MMGRHAESPEPMPGCCVRPIVMTSPYAIHIKCALTGRFLSTLRMTTHLEVLAQHLLILVRGLYVLPLKARV